MHQLARGTCFSIEVAEIQVTLKKLKQTYKNPVITCILYEDFMNAMKFSKEN